MKIKFNPVLYIFALYICISGYLIFSYFSFQQHLTAIKVINLNPVAYGLLIFSSIILTLSLFSLFRIPIFHYLFKMFHLWMVILCSFTLYLFFKYGQMLTDIVKANTPQKIAAFFPGTNPEIFNPYANLIKSFLQSLHGHIITLILIITIILAVIQIILYMPSSLRYVYYTHVSPFKYTLKHILVSILLLAPLLFLANYFFKLDTSLNPALNKLLTQKQEHVNDHDNVFFPMLTLWMPDVPNRTTYGKNWLSEFRNMLAYFRQHHASPEPTKYPKYQGLALAGMSKKDQATINQLYILRMQNDDKKIDEKIVSYIKKYQGPLQVIQTLYKSKRYQNPINFTAFSYTNLFSDYSGSFLSLQRLKLLEYLIGPDIDTGSIVKNIMDNYVFNLIVAKHSNDPNVKLLHIQKQAIIIQFLYNLINNQKFQNKTTYKLIIDMHVLGKDVMNQTLIAKKNIQLLKNRLDQANTSLSRANSITADSIRYTYKYNKTLNCLYERAKKKFNLDNKNIFEHIKNQNVTSTKASLNNVIGDELCEASMPDSKNDLYIKALETNGRIMILKARSKMYEENINIFNIATYLNNHSTKYYNPFSGKPLKWDRDTHEIYFVYNNGKENIKVSY